MQRQEKYGDALCYEWLPGNRLEALDVSREGQYSIRISHQYRICFGWTERDAVDVGKW
jgi:plasmid maintenance system killer protein